MRFLRAPARRDVVAPLAFFRPDPQPTARIAGLLPCLEMSPQPPGRARSWPTITGIFEPYDLVTFPVLYDTSAAEASEVDILRVSPEDAMEGKGMRLSKAAGVLVAGGRAIYGGWQLWVRRGIGWRCGASGPCACARATYRSSLLSHWERRAGEVRAS